MVVMVLAVMVVVMVAVVVVVLAVGVISSSSISALSWQAACSTLPLAFGRRQHKGRPLVPSLGLRSSLGLLDRVAGGAPCHSPPAARAAPLVRLAHWCCSKSQRCSRFRCCRRKRCRPLR